MRGLGVGLPLAGSFGTGLSLTGGLGMRLFLTGGLGMRRRMMPGRRARRPTVRCLRVRFPGTSRAGGRFVWGVALSVPVKPLVTVVRVRPGIPGRWPTRRRPLWTLLGPRVMCFRLHPQGMCLRP